MKLSAAGARLIESFEGFQSAPYHGQLDPRGLWTIGYGTTEGVGPNTRPVTRSQAQAMLMRDVDRRFAPAVNALRLPLNQNQFDALVSFVYNVGPVGIAATGHVGRALRAHDWKAAADALLLWNRAGGSVSAGLVRRRQLERALFLRPVDGPHHHTPPAHHNGHHTPPAHHNGHHPPPPHHDEPPDHHQPPPHHHHPRAELTSTELEAASHNGSVPAHLLAAVPGGRLRLDAAAAFNAMNAESERRFHVTLRSEGPLGTYRTVPQQRYLYQLYEEGRGSLAAWPGTSNHGLGLAIDLATPQMRTIVNAIGERYGWAKRWSDAPSEWWHLRYRRGVWHPSDTTADAPARPRSRPDTRTEATAIVQQLLRRHGHPTLSVDGQATPGTRAALRAFQHAHGLEPTGELNHATVAALRGHPVPPPKRPVPDHGQAHMPPHPRHRPTHASHRPPRRRPRRRRPPGQPGTTHPPQTRTRRTKEHEKTKPPILNQPRLPLNRIVALAGPFIAIFAGVAASWLSQHFPGLVTDENTARADIIQGTTFVVAMLSTWGLQHKYLDGWSKWEGGLLDVEAAKQTSTGDDDYYGDDDSYYEDSYYGDDDYESDDYGDEDESYPPYDVDPSMLERQDGEYSDWDAGRS